MRVSTILFAAVAVATGLQITQSEAFSRLAAPAALAQDAKWTGEPANLSTKRLTVPSAGATRHFQVKSETPWTLAPDAPWVSVAPATGGKGVFNITVSVAAAPVAGTERNAAIKFTNGERTQTAWVPVAQVNEANYYRDGDVIVLHRATPPAGLKPIPVIFIGDGWDLSDFKKGTGVFETYTRALTKVFLNVDIVKDFTNLFDVYAYCAESECRGKRGFNPFGTSSSTGTDFGKMARLGGEFLKKIGHPNAKNVTYLAATNAGVGGYAIHGTFAIVSNPSNQHGYAYWMVHEYVGHVMANMPDLYFGNPGWVLDRGPDVEKEFDPITKRWFPATYNKGKVKDVRNMVRNFNREWRRGYDWNVDWTDNPKEAIWKDFVGKPGYENVGAFPTGWNVFGGFMGPEKLDAMRDLNHLWFSVGSRMWLWNRIQERAGIEDPPSYIEHPEADHPRSLKSFKAFDIAKHYNTNGKNVNTFVEDPILTREFWDQNDIWPDRPDAAKTEANGAGKPYVSVFPPKVRFATNGAAGGKNVQKIIVSANQKATWKIEGVPAWLTVCTAGATGSAEIEVTATANTTGAPRRATLTFSAPGAISRTVLVEQK